jgi:methyl-galactoside transport system substrate-binding protein
VKNYKGLIVFGALMFSTSIISGCSEEYKVNKKNEIKIGVTLYKQDDTFIASISSYLEEISKEKEQKEDIKIQLDFVDAKGSLTNQGNQIDKFIKQDYDIICVNLVDRTAAATIIDKAKSANVPLVFFNREPVEEDLNRWNKVYYVGAQARRSARMQAEIVIEEWTKNKSKIDKNGDNKIQYVMLEGEPGHQDALIRTEYCIKDIDDYGIELEKLADDSANWQSDQAISKMNQWIQEFGDEIEVVFSNNDVMSLGAIHSINSTDVFSEKPIVVGIDGIKEALEAVQKGELTGTVISDAKVQAKAIFDISYSLARGLDVNNVQGINGKYVKTQHTKVTSKNVDGYLGKKEEGIGKK